MASGYEKHNDYGGPPPSLTEFILLIAFIILVSAAIATII